MTQVMVYSNLSGNTSERLSDTRTGTSEPRSVTTSGCGIDHKQLVSCAEYFRENVDITPSGMFNQAQLQYCVATLGVDRILYSVDYPFIGNDAAVSFLDEARLSDEEKHRIAHQNTETLLGL